MTLDSRTASELYDSTAHTWVRSQPNSLSDFTARPAVIELCGALDGVAAVDLGCGEGYCTRLLKKGGAGDVLGMDISGGMIALARAEEQRAPLGIRYAQADAGRSTLTAQSLDLVTAVFLFNYLSVQDTRACMKEVARALRPGGRFVFSVPHPFFPFLRAPEAPFYFAFDTNDYFEARDRRFPGKIWKRDGTSLEVQVVHKTFEDYFEGLKDAGFVRLPTLRELRVTPAILAQDPKFFSPLLGVPLHVAIAIER